MTHPALQSRGPAPVLVREGNITHVFRVSPEDHERVLLIKWYINRGRKSIRARGHTGTKWVYLHRYVVDAPPFEEVDHIDRDAYNCTRGNLRLATRHEQERNKPALRRSRTGLRGVSPLPQGGYQARLMYYGKLHYIGRFDVAWHARLAYLIKEWELMHG